MASVKHGPLTVDTVAVRRKPAFTYQSPPQSTIISHLEKSQIHSPQSTIIAPSLAPPSPPNLPQMLEVSQISTVTRKSSRHHMTTALLPLYHPFGTLALSLPDLDPGAFGLPAPVAVFDDPTRRASNRHRRPAAKVRDADDPIASHPPSFVEETPALEVEVREKSSPRRRRGGGPGGKRKRREHDDGDATYPAKRPRNPRSSGVASGLSSARVLSREGCSPALSNGHSGGSPALDVGRVDTTEEKKPERRTTRSRGAIIRRDSTASEDTASSASASLSVSNTAVLHGEPVETDQPISNGTTKKASASGDESKKTEANDLPVLEQQES